MKIGLILRPDIEAADLERIIKEDWEQDSADKLVISDEDKEDQKKIDQAQADFEAQPQKTYEQIDKQKLYDGLFTLADTWCPSIDSEEYKEFFEQLAYRLKYQGMQDNAAYDLL